MNLSNDDILLIKLSIEYRINKLKETIDGCKKYNLDCTESETMLSLYKGILAKLQK